MVDFCKCVNGVHEFKVSVSHNGEEARSEAGDEIFASSCADNSVVCTRNSGAVICCHHEAHLNELASIPRQPAHTVVRQHKVVMKVKNFSAVVYSSGQLKRLTSVGTRAAPEFLPGRFLT